MLIDDPAAVLFCNVRIRRLAGDIRRVYLTHNLVAAEFAAKGIPGLVPDDPDAVIADGSPGDGKTPITGADVRVMMALAADLLAMAAGPSGKIGTVLKVASLNEG